MASNDTTDFIREQKDLPSLPPGLVMADETFEWLAGVWAQRNRPFDLPYFKEERDSLWRNLCNVKWRVLWRPGIFRPKNPVPSAADFEAVRLMNRLKMPDRISNLLADVGLDADKCCDPNLKPNEKRTGSYSRLLKRGVRDQALEATPEAKKPKTESSPPHPRDADSQASTSSFLQNPKELIATPSKPANANAPAVSAFCGFPLKANESNTASPFARANMLAGIQQTTAAAGPSVRAASASPYQKPKPASLPTQTPTLAGASLAASAAETSVRAPILDSNTANQNATSIKKADFEAIIDAYLRQKDEAQQKRKDNQDEKQNVFLEVVQQNAQDVKTAWNEGGKARKVRKAAIEEHKKARQVLKAATEKIEKIEEAMEAAVEEEDKARLNVTTLLKNLSRRIAATSEQPIKQE
ncbi:hypothetical protein CSOJ01_06446 [Colletotrichum sojae]|uniref:Uncharacterized protein n=1 Tax=Colletotrichum sojae TaxID=2175907 RepID=A0A8H6JCX4_9PEZI|nr:hypothetical protein CSOJ01_06446 [Colletotrichum sojae]